MKSDIATKLIIKQIAKEVRKQCERFAMSHKSSNFDFHNNRDLTCMCAVASYTLQTILHQKGITTKFIYGTWHKDEKDKYGYNHCWLTWNSFVIDITATQFGGSRKVIITKDYPKHYNYPKHYKPKEIIQDPTRLRWGPRQSPSNYLVDIISIL